MPANEPSQSGLQARHVPSPVGDLRLVVSDRGLRAVDWPSFEGDLASGASGHAVEDRGSCTMLDDVERELGEYFAGRRRSFGIPLDPVGTPFQLSAWKVLSGIPYGSTISYADQARMLGDVKKARAVGGANGRNPIPIIVPCHRVIGADGSLTGFAVGTEIKQYLLELERAHA